MKSIATKISVYVGLLVLIVSVSLGWLAYNNGSSAVLAEVEQALVLQAEEASRYIDSTFKVHLSTLETIAVRPDITGMNWDLQRPVIQSEGQRLPQFLALGIADTTGVVRYADGSSANLADRAHIKSALAGKSVMSDLVVSRTDGALVLMGAVPIKQDGRVVGVLLGRMDGTALNDITDGLGFGPNGWAHIFHNNGAIYAHPNRQYVLDQKNLFTDTGDLAAVGSAVNELGVGNTGIIRFSLDNSIRLNGLASIPSTGWIVGIGVQEQDVLGNVNRLRSFLVIISIILIAVGVVAAVIISRQIANPLIEVQHVVEAVADGDLTKTADVKTKDEVGRMAAAVNTTIASLREAMGVVGETTNELAGTSEQMAAAAQEVSASIEEVASTTNQFSSALDMMNTNAQTMTTNVQGISIKSAHGATAIQDIVKEVNALQTNTAKLAKDISGLGNLSNQIGQIVNVIDEIAEQTNLLALNAAIEAARAGEHGRGFAVVADEVRRLAEQSANATTEITSLIAQIQGGIATAVTGMNDGAAQTARVSTSVDESGTILRDILTEVEDIVGAVQSISSGLEETNSSGHEIASATEEQAASIEEIASSASNLTSLGARLQGLVQRFKLS